MIPFVNLREAQELLQDIGAFAMRPHLIQNLISVTMSNEVLTIPGVILQHITINIQATYLRV